MTRSTIDFGIDLGTTNSAIAVLQDVGTRIIKNNEDQDITPSAVWIDRNERVFVGTAAKNKNATASDDSYLAFKRMMGTDFVYKFRQAKVERRPEDLSAEVLKELKVNVEQRMGESIQAAVITVPAAFELPQCDATRRAAEAAGLVESPLLQEPVAAALAYGFQIDAQKAYWLVYDFGGGTFDAAVLKAEEGTIRVVNHGGDNYLGGSDIDRAIVNELIVPRIVAEHGLEEFTLSNRRWGGAFGLMRRAAEVAKIQLSRKEETNLMDCEFDNGHGNIIEVDYRITRDDVRRIAEPFVSRSVQICQRVLSEKNLNKSAIERVILVGGPTLAPYFREMLADQLGIRLDHSVDPLTVVACGAAIFAGTQRRTTSVRTAPGTVTLELKYSPVGVDANPLIGGRIIPPSGVSLSGFTIELAEQKTRWRSGRIPVAETGIFTATLKAEPGHRNTYAIELLDSRGNRFPTTPELLTYTIGAAVNEQVLPHSIGIALSNNQFDRLFDKGQSLPAKATRRYASDVSIKKGQSGAALRVPACEGESPLGDRNRLVGFLEIEATEISRDLPKGSDIEVTLKIDASREVTIDAYVPLLDKDFRAVLKSFLPVRSADEIRKDVEAEEARVQELKEQAVSAGDREGVKMVERIEVGGALEGVRDLARDADDTIVRAKAEGRLLELKITIDQAESRLEWPRIAAETEEFIAHFNAIAEESGDAKLKLQVDVLASELRRIIKTRNMDDLRERRAQADDLYGRTLYELPSFWVYMFQELETRAVLMSDPNRARRLIDQGRTFVSHNNVDGLRNVVQSLQQMLPDEAGEKIQRGYKSGVRRVR